MYTSKEINHIYLEALVRNTNRNRSQQRQMMTNPIQVATKAKGSLALL